MGNAPSIKYAYFADGEESKGETKPLRHFALKPEEPLVSTFYPDVDDLKKSFIRTCQEHPTSNCFGTRRVLKETLGQNARTKKPEIQREFGEYEWKTYEEVKARAETLA